ncbi:FAD-dependent oxidoreductase [Herbaspirillum huttiense]|uniref:FAD-dependent oxidoreductase n=1 Tax=Herbaspirillum huttiense TaxID=863372 RepID=UPI001E56C6EE|nr:FAD-dependent oxidoreductase [Herbaspirillum huttiense]
MLHSFAGAAHMKVVVIGGGIIGTATAYWLATRHVEVVLIEREADVACQTSAPPSIRRYATTQGERT